MDEKKEIGTVISTSESPSPSSVDFVVNKGVVHRGQFVEIPCGEGTMICLVNDVVKTNRYFERADSVKEFESSGSALSEQFPTTEWEYLVAKTRPLGIFANDGSTKRPTFPPSPGARVKIAAAASLEKFLNFDKEAGLHLGVIERHEVPVMLNLSSLLKKHLAILALSGAGKSYLVSVLLEELLDRKKQSGRIAIVVLDPHGEYNSFAEPVSGDKHKDYSAKTKLVRAGDIQIGVPKLSVGLIAGIIPGLSSTQKRDLARIITKLREEMRRGMGPFDLNDLRDAAMRDSEIKDNTRGTLLAWVDDLRAMRLFGKTDEPSVSDLIKPGGLTVIDLSDLIDLRKKQVIVSYFAQRLFYERRNKTVPPFLLVLEEAHQFCLSEDTDILTVEGWKKYSMLKKGDLAFSYDIKSNKLMPAPIKRIIMRNHAGELVKLFNEDSVDSLVTYDHRVLCDRRTTGWNRKWKWGGLDFVPAKDLPSGFKIPVAAKCRSKADCNIDRDLIKILGWIITDGTLRFCNNRRQFYYEISQSVAKGKILEEMHGVVARRFPGARIHSRTRPSGTCNGREISRSKEFIFYLGKDATDEIKPWLGNVPHRIPRQFLENASRSQLLVMFNALVQGDGNVQHSKNGHKYVTFYAGKDRGIADDFQELCIRLGLSAVIKFVPFNNQLKVLVSFKRKFAYVRKIAKEYFSGKVWDITIKNGAFVARRNGKVFITGNCPQWAKEETAISRGIIRTIAREGRKFGACLCLVSQRPVQLDTTTLSQANTHIILRITNPYDLKHIGESSEGLDSKSIDMITSLRVGEALIVGEATRFPLFFKVRKRRSAESRHEIPLEKAALDFEEGKEKGEKETEELL
ncbi:MAG: DUF87 domain-containing protein [Candidatus Diapherotrites archaeon]|nr:DUF87 domain-containing protein [Candidatus Diapherotrites archaeon]